MKTSLITFVVLLATSTVFSQTDSLQNIQTTESIQTDSLHKNKPIKMALI